MKKKGINEVQMASISNDVSIILFKSGTVS